MQTTVVALLGAESTGKTALSHALVARAHRLDIPAVLVEETLRTWVNAHGRLPAAHDQASIATTHEDAITRAVSALKATRQEAHALVIADTTSIMTAAYSRYYFQDDAIWEQAHAAETAGGKRIRLLMGLDLPWQEEAGQRDGPQHQGGVDTLLRQHLSQHGWDYHVVYGKNEARVDAAWRTIATQLSREDWLDAQPESQGRSDWVCQDCSDPDCERYLFTRLLAAKSNNESSK